MAEVNYSKKQINPIIEKFAINPETNTMFNRIINMFAEQTNYQGWALRAVFGKKASIEDIENIKAWADKNQTHIKLLIKQNIVSYSTVSEFTQLFNEMRGLDMIAAVKSTIEKFNTAQRKMLNDAINKCNVKNGLDALTNASFMQWYNLFRQFEEIIDHRKNLFITKASAYTNLSSLKSGIEDTLKESYEWNKEDMLSFVKRNTPNCKIVYNKDNIVILQVTSFDDSHKLCGSGRTGWCITREASYFRQYVTDKTGNRQYFYFDFSKKDNDELAHIGFTVNNNNGIVNAHSTRNSSLLGEGITYNGKRTNIHTVLSNNKIKASVYLTLKDLKNFKWDLESVLKFLEAHGDMYAISMSENNRIIVRCMNRSALQLLCDHTLININNVPFNQNESVYVALDLNLNKDDDYATLCLDFVKDRYKTFTESHVWNTYNADIKNENYLSSIGIPRDKYLGQEKIPATLLLHKLIEEKNEKDACELIEKEGENFDVNFEFEKQTPIFLSMQNNMFGLFSAIINHKRFNADAKDIFGENIFTALLYEYYGKLITSPSNKKEIKALEDMIKIILDSKSYDFNIINMNLDTAVNIACQYPQLTWIAKALIENPNVNINVVNDFNCSALGCAIYGGNVDAIKMLASREDFTVRKDDMELAANKNLTSVLAEVANVAVAC